MTHPPTFIITELMNLRQEKNLTRSELAALISCESKSMEPASLKNYELGYADPGIRRVVAWAAALGYELDLHPIGRKL